MTSEQYAAPGRLVVDVVEHGMDAGLATVCLSTSIAELACR